MRRRFIITTSIALILFTVCLFGINVYASMTQNFSISSKIGFTADTDVRLALDCSVSGCKQSELTTPPSGSQYKTIEEWKEAVGITHTEKYEEGVEQDWGNKSWKITETLDFIDYSTEIVYTIKITNYSTVDVKVKLTPETNSSTDQLLERNRFYNLGSGEKTLDDNGFTIGAYNKNTQVKKEATVYLKVKVKDSTRSFTVDNNFTLQVDATNYEG